MGKNGADQSGARRSDRSRAKRALNRERTADQEEQSVVRRAGQSGVECRKQYINIRVKRSEQIRAEKSESERR